jgi:hypothetical protein
VTPCSMIKVHQCFRGTYCLHLQSWRYSKQATSKEYTAFILRVRDMPSKQVTCLAYFCLKVEALHSSKTLVNLYWATDQHITDDSTDHSLILSRYKTSDCMPKAYRIWWATQVYPWSLVHVFRTCYLFWVLTAWFCYFCMCFLVFNVYSSTFYI